MNATPDPSPNKPLSGKGLEGLLDISPGPRAKFQEKAQRALDKAKTDKARAKILAIVARKEGLKDIQRFVNAGLRTIASLDKHGRLGVDYAGNHHSNLSKTSLIGSFMNPENPSKSQPDHSSMDNLLSQNDQIEELKKDLELTETEMIRLLNESAEKDIKIDSLKASCDELNKQIQESKLWDNLSPFWRIVAVALLIVCLKAIFSPVSHRLSPDIGSADDEFGREGQVTGFHYEKKTWWGFRKQVYNEVRFVKNRGPQYLDGNEWQDIPEEAWGNAVVDDRAMEMDNRGWHEQ